MDLEPKEMTTLDEGDTRVITWSRVRELLTAPSPPDEPGGYFPSYLSTVRGPSVRTNGELQGMGSTRR